MALTTTTTTTISSSSSQLFHLPLIHPPSYSSQLQLTGCSFIQSKCQLIALRNTNDVLFPLKISTTGRYRGWCTRSTEETLTNDNDEVYRDEDKVDDSSSRRNVSYSSDSLNLGIREPVYEVVEVSSSGKVSTRKISRRHLLKSSGLRPRDIRSVDPSLWLTNTMPSLLVWHQVKLLFWCSVLACEVQDFVTPLLALINAHTIP
ncbi:hypothetical protein M8C21_024132 [Ambrosia artemisiifolia]|uniref:Uncharacterized protein n=1 Tax=Ambrosia artemisiifolia TaxID=4212 RepID=A0AAD5C8V4_AMBAR|nr:hypothetical protein M8C21_024132 [Ambrosia artemisiifolia]